MGKKGGTREGGGIRNEEMQEDTYIGKYTS